MNLEKKYKSLAKIINKDNLANKLAVDACFSLLSAANKIDKECASRLGDYQLSEGRFMVLVLLLEYEVLSPQEIAKLSGVTKPTITMFISSLLKKGLINKTEAESDGRKMNITLTEDGRELITKLFKSHSQWITNITNKLTNSEMENLIFLLNKMFQHKGD